MTMSPDARFRWPDGFVFQSFQNADDRRVRYGVVKPKGAVKATVVIFPGFRECAEKYFEVINDLLAEGYAVAIMDWVGQGGSARYLREEPHKAHSEGYDKDVRDAKQFIDEVVKIESGGEPLLALAHSMGAHRLLYVLKDEPHLFKGAVLSAPMMDIQTAPLPKSAARSVARFAKSAEALTQYIPGGRDWEEKNHPFKTNRVTSDESRYVQNFYFTQNPALITGDPTYGWIYESFLSIDRVNKESFLKAIHTPVLMAMAMGDQVVDVAAQKRASLLLPNCTALSIPDAKHEILCERDEIRELMMKEMFAFFQKTLALKKTVEPSQGQHARKAGAPKL
jgi:lysophospholipase